MEPVIIVTEVRRGGKAIFSMYSSPRGLGVWSAPTPDADIMTPDGPICEIIVQPSLRRPGYSWDPRDAILHHEGEAERLPAPGLNAQRIAELEREGAFDLFD